MALELDLEQRKWTAVWEGHITHNLGHMAEEAGIYNALWRPDECGITRGRDLIEPLRVGLARLEAEPERFRAFNPENGWGSYETLVKFVRQTIAACEKYPKARVRAWR
jgi:hypothetical protein